MTTELIEPELLEQTEGEDGRKMASEQHGSISALLLIYLGSFVLQHKLGRTLDSSTTYDFQDGQPKRMPDVSFVEQIKMPVVRDQNATAIPDLVVEVVSKNDTFYDNIAKLKQYQKAGVKLIWIVYPFAEKVAVYRLAKGLLAQELGTADELDGEDVLPGFKLEVGKIFE